MPHYDVSYDEAGRILDLASLLEGALKAKDDPGAIDRAAKWLIADLRYALGRKGLPSWKLMAAEILGLDDEGGSD